MSRPATQLPASIYREGSAPPPPLRVREVAPVSHSCGSGLDQEAREPFPTSRPESVPRSRTGGALRAGPDLVPEGRPGTVPGNRSGADAEPSPQILPEGRAAPLPEARPRPIPEARPGGAPEAQPRPAPNPEPSPDPDPFTDADALEALEEEITVLAAHIHAATHRLLTLIAEFDRRRGWELGGHRSCAHWLSFRTGIDLATAREKVRTARALAGLPQTGKAMARGELSFSQVRALSRVANQENEAALLALAQGCTTAQLERMVRGFRRGSREDEAEADERWHRSRTLSVFPDEDGMYVVRGRIPAEVGALLMRAVEAASDALYRRERRECGAEEGPQAWASDQGPGRSDESQVAAAQRRADALGLLAERALAVGFENGPISGSRAERYQVVLHVDPETLEAPTDPSDERRVPGRSELEDGTRVSSETSRRISCDAGLVPVRHGHDGSILDVGRRTRNISPALRRALEYRDRGCRFPGCGLRFTDAHHVRHWAEGGETSLDNCVLLCRYHHRLIHEGGWEVEWWGSGRPVFFDPRGGTHFEGGWKAPEGLGDIAPAAGIGAPGALDRESAGRNGSGPAFTKPAEEVAVGGPRLARSSADQEAELAVGGGYTFSEDSEEPPGGSPDSTGKTFHLKRRGAPMNEGGLISGLPGNEEGSARSRLQATPPPTCQTPASALAEKRPESSLTGRQRVSPPSSEPPRPALGTQSPASGRITQQPLSALIEENRRRGIEPDAWTASARWQRETEIPDRIYFQALEALAAAEVDRP